jgi:FixJ family two-component response regulator
MEMLNEIDCEVTCFSRADKCIDTLKQNSCSLLITAMELSGMDGMAVLSKTKNIAPWTPVIVITACEDIAMAVRAIKSGATDFLHKPVRKDVFVNKVRAILFRDEFVNQIMPHKLTDAEMKVLNCILDGQGNKQIAQELSCAVRTIEFHRSNIYKKFEVDNVVDLTKKAMAMFSSVDGNQV